MNRLDKFIGYLFPRAALDRARSRARLELVQNSRGRNRIYHVVPRDY